MSSAEADEPEARGDSGGGDQHGEEGRAQQQCDHRGGHARQPGPVDLRARPWATVCTATSAVSSATGTSSVKRRTRGLSIMRSGVTSPVSFSA
jgi:hypothetical protein